MLENIKSIVDSGPELTIKPNEKTFYEFDNSEYWRKIPLWRKIDAETFGDHQWQLKNSITTIRKLKEATEGFVPEIILKDIDEGLLKTHMNMRVTPYIFSRINWVNHIEDPLRRQFIPLGSEFIKDHPKNNEDSLAEDENKVSDYLVHRYPNKALFLPITICPVYCTFCTRSRLVGGSTAVKSKSSYGAKSVEWDKTFEYIRNTPTLEDIVISGGDASLLQADQIRQIGIELLKIKHIRRIRFATKALSILPMKFTFDQGWVDALAEVAKFGLKRMKEVALHTHINSDNEITSWTLKAMEKLSEFGIKVRNQSVLIDGVNSKESILQKTMRQLAYLLIEPYYVYLHDMVPGCEHLRTSLRRAEDLSLKLQGSMTGFNTPRVVCDAPGGGGKRDVSSYISYDQDIGISAWTSPSAKPGKIFYYFDPIHKLAKESQIKWKNSKSMEEKINDFKKSCLEKITN
tara:strand:+ start:219 stop:1598 length:1380 start_codon:yes stop_codon:yes gene_type:complete